MTPPGKPPAVRARILGLIERNPKGLSTTAAAQELGLNIATACTHLSKLAAYGDIDMHRNVKAGRKATWLPKGSSSAQPNASTEK